MTRNNLKYNKKVKCDGRTDGRTDGPTDGQSVSATKNVGTEKRHTIFSDSHKVRHADSNRRNNRDKTKINGLCSF